MRLQALQESFHDRDFRQSVRQCYNIGYRLSPFSWILFTPFESLDEHRHVGSRESFFTEPVEEFIDEKFYLFFRFDFTLRDCTIHIIEESLHRLDFISVLAGESCLIDLEHLMDSALAFGQDRSRKR